MNDEEKISKKILITMFIACMVLLVAVIFVCIFNSPKFMTPSFSENDVPEELSEASDSLKDSQLQSDSVFPIEINSATLKELQLIPNIGPSTAKMIIDYRNEYGTIVSFSELKSIDGIGEKTVEILKEYCIIN